MKTLHERIPLAGFSKLPSIPQIAKVNCLAWLELVQQRLCQAVPGSAGQQCLGSQVKGHLGGAVACPAVGFLQGEHVAVLWHGGTWDLACCILSWGQPGHGASQ